MKAKSILQPRTERNGTIKLRSWEQVNKFKEEGGEKRALNTDREKTFLPSPLPLLSYKS